MTVRRWGGGRGRGGKGGKEKRAFTGLGIAALACEELPKKPFISFGFGFPGAAPFDIPLPFVCPFAIGAAGVWVPRLGVGAALVASTDEADARLFPLTLPEDVVHAKGC